MDIRSDYFYIYLVVHCLIYHSEAASRDQREELVKKTHNRWTKNETADLIFFDVITDNGKPNHFYRIKKKWFQKYPNSNTTDVALRQKLRALRKTWQSEEEYKGHFKWDEPLERELMDVYFNTRPYVKKATIRYDEEWKRRHRDYKASKDCLLSRITAILNKNKYPDYVPLSSEGASSQARYAPADFRIRHRWTVDEKAALLHFHALTDTGKPGRFERIRSMWREHFPESNVSDVALLHMYRKLRPTTRKEVAGDSKRYVKWTPEEDKKLLHIFLNTYPYRDDVNISFGEAWKQQRERHHVLNKYLMYRARRLLIENKYPEYTAQALTKQNLQPDRQHGSLILDSGRFQKEESSDYPLTDLAEGSKAESSKSRSRKGNKFQPKMRSVKNILWGHEEAKPEKRSGKAPMVYSSDESTLFSPTMMPEDSE